MWITKDIDPETFKKEIFAKGANGFSPVVINWEDLPGSEGLQLLEDYLEKGRSETIHRAAIQQLGTYIGVAGVGQYSLKGKETSALARFDIRFRHPTQNEMRADFEHWGEQVCGELTPEVLETAPRFNIFGTPVLYTGPSRIREFVFNTRVFEGPRPQSLDKFVADIERNCPVQEDAPTQVWHLFHARRGDIEYCAFPQPTKYQSKSLKAFGRIYRTGSQLLFQPTGSEEKIDYTELLSVK